MGKYEQLAKDIIKNVGGKENVLSLTHCRPLTKSLFEQTLSFGLFFIPTFV